VSLSVIPSGGQYSTGVVVYSTADARVFGATVCINLVTGVTTVNAPCPATDVPADAAVPGGPSTRLLRGSANDEVDVDVVGPEDDTTTAVPQPHQFHVGTQPSVALRQSSNGQVYMVEVGGTGERWCEGGGLLRARWRTCDCVSVGEWSPRC